jgi:hypothetical protein
MDRNSGRSGIITTSCNFLKIPRFETSFNKPNKEILVLLIHVLAYNPSHQCLEEEENTSNEHLSPPGSCAFLNQPNQEHAQKKIVSSEF